MAYEPQQKAKSKNQREATKSAKKQKRNSKKPFNFYGIRETQNSKYMCVTLVRENEDGEREWINVPVHVKYTSMRDNHCLLALKLLTTSKRKGEDEDEDEDEDYKKAKAKAKKYIEDNEDLPF